MVSGGVFINRDARPNVMPTQHKKRPFGGYDRSDAAVNKEIVIPPEDFLECMRWNDVLTCKVGSLNGEFHSDFNFAEDEDATVLQVLIPGKVTPLNGEFNFRPEKTMTCRAIDNSMSGTGKRRADGSIHRKMINIVCEYGHFEW